MASKKLPVAILFLSGILPVTGIALFAALVGLPFFILGVIDFLRGNIDLGLVLSQEKPGIALLWVTAPLGLFGLYTLWKVTYLYYRGIPIKNRKRIVIGLVAGTIAGIQMLTIQVGFLLFLLPSLLYFSLQLYKDINHVGAET